VEGRKERLGGIGKKLILELVNKKASITVGLFCFEVVCLFLNIGFYEK
jgi:hypothetical protein